MFKKKVSVEAVTVIAKGATVNGLQTQSDVIILGIVKGDLSGNCITIHGTVEGNVVATGKIFLQSGSKVTGSVDCAAIEIEEGTTFSNKLNVGPVENRVTFEQESEE